MIGWRFSDYVPGMEGESPFERLLKVFQELLLYTSGDVSEALSWLTELDKQYQLTDENYGVADFIQDLIDKGFIQQDGPRNPGFVPSAKMELQMRQRALDDIFGQLKKAKSGRHDTRVSGKGDEFTSDLRPYEFGDKLEQLAISESLRNAQINHGIDDFRLTHEDLEVRETYYQSQMSTVLMIDISHSMILYGKIGSLRPKKWRWHYRS
jgi:Ca-activated chloride channel family protein